MCKLVEHILGSIRDFVQVELAISYSYSLLLGLFGIVSILTGLTTMNTTYTPFAFGFDISLPFTGNEDVERYFGYFSSRRGLALVYSLKVSFIAFSFLMPMVIAFSFSRFFEDGTLRTILSYPIARTHYLLTKSIILLALTFIFSLISGMFWIVLWFPFGTGIEYLFIILISAFASFLILVSSLILLSIISRKISTTAIVGLSVWGVLMYLIEFTRDVIPLEVIEIMNPLKIAEYYVTGYPLELLIFDVGISIATSITLSFVCLLIAVFLFKRTEV